MQKILSTLRLKTMFLQPFVFCSNKCQGCYLKSYKTKHKFNNPRIHLDLLQEIFHTQKDLMVTDQVTISLNSLFKGKYSSSNHQMLRWFAKAIHIIGTSTLDNTPEVHLTFHDIITFSKYTQYIKKHRPNLFNDYINFMKKVTVVSLSSISITDNTFYRRAAQIIDKVNWNWLITPDYKIEDDIEYVREILEVVNSAYMILYKNPLKQEQDSNSIPNYINTYKYLEKNLEPRLLQKINTDRCLFHACDYHKSGFGCSANINLTHIWPNGRPTGCPYNSSGVIKTSVVDYLQTIYLIRGQRNRWEFDKCQLPKLYQEVIKCLN